MTFTKDQIELIDQLVDELTKENPDLALVKSNMKSLGLKYSHDPVERLNTVLMALHPKVEEPAQDIEA